MSDLERDLAAFYDQEAEDRRRRPLDPRRERARDQFVDLLRAEGRTDVIEIGPGAGRDAGALVAAGFTVAAVDLSPANVRICRQLGVDARVASVLDLPWPDDTFDAGFTMSTLLHLDDADIDSALSELERVVAPGSPVAIGLWGGEDVVRVKDDDVYSPKRTFFMRTDDSCRRILERHGVVERFTTWPSEAPDSRWHYQWAVLRLAQD